MWACHFSSPIASYSDSARFGEDLVENFVAYANPPLMWGATASVALTLHYQTPVVIVSRMLGTAVRMR